MTKFDKLFNSILNEEIELRRPRDVVTIPQHFGRHRTEYTEIERKRKEMKNISIEVDEKVWKDEILKKYPNAKFTNFSPGGSKSGGGITATVDNMVVGAVGGHFMHKEPWQAYIYKRPISQEEFGFGAYNDWYKYYHLNNK